MNHKEKAAELIEKFRPFAHKNFNHVNDGETEKAKQCAIIHVEGILNTGVLFNDFTALTTECEPEQTYKFWQEVKKELTI